MILFPHAKINLGLNVLARRSDGYHDIETIMVPIPLHDALEAIITPELGSNGLVFTRSGTPVPGNVEMDLCYKAVRALQRTHVLPGLRLHLHKVIPMGAGLGGGSSDGTHTLLLLNKLCDLGADPNSLAALALELGSDCPFFLQKEASVVRGRGEELTPVPLDLKGKWLVLANPGIHISTAEVYQNTVPTGTSWEIERHLVHTEVHEWRSVLPNTMEPYVLKKYPAVGALKKLLLESGAFYTAMSGSGSSVFGLFHAPPTLPPLDPVTRIWKLRL